MSTDSTQTLPPPAPVAPEPVLRRSSTDRMIAGVCGGLGARYGVDPMVLRVVFVVSVLAGGVGLFAYLALWLLIPDDRSPDTGTLTRSLIPLVVGVLLALVAIAGLIGWFGNLGGFAGIVVAAFLLGLVVWLYQQKRPHRQMSGTVASVSSDVAQPPYAMATGTAAAPPTGFAYGGTGYAPGAGPTPPPRPPVDHSYLGVITLCAALVVGALLAALSAAGIALVSFVGGLAAVLAVLAMGMVIGAWRGRAKWLVIIALPLALMLGLVGQVVSLMTAAPDSSIGIRSWEPTQPTDLVLGAGQADLDLRAWESSGAPAPKSGDVVNARVGFGQLNVVIPDTWQVVVDARTGAGNISVNGEPVVTRNATSQFQQTLEPVSGDADGRLKLVLNVDVGEIVIKQRPATSSDPAGPPAPTESPQAVTPNQKKSDSGADRQSQSQNQQRQNKENSR